MQGTRHILCWVTDTFKYLVLPLHPQGIQAVIYVTNIAKQPL